VTRAAQTFVRRRADVIGGLAGLALLAVCGTIARSGTVGPMEQRAFRAINALPDGVEPVMNGAQFLGILAVGPVVAVVAAILRRWRLAAAALIVTAGKLAAERLVWEVVQRDRPGVTEPVVHVRGDTAAAGLSFVSGHVVLVTGLACVITPYLRGRWRVLPWAAVVLVGFARIYLGAHNPLDVLGGFGLGLALGAATNLIVGTPEEPPP
jgi:membrane-associated phospholipid phosphatase